METGLGTAHDPAAIPSKVLLPTDLQTLGSPPPKVHCSSSSECNFCLPRAELQTPHLYVSNVQASRAHYRQYLGAIGSPHWM